MPERQKELRFPETLQDEADAHVSRQVSVLWSYFHHEMAKAADAIGIRYPTAEEPRKIMITVENGKAAEAAQKLAAWKESFTVDELIKKRMRPEYIEAIPLIEFVVAEPIRMATSEEDAA